MIPLLALAAASALLLGCGSGAPEIPPELLETDSPDSADYPPGPYLPAVGSTLENLRFEGWPDPLAAGFDPAALERIEFADFYDPDDRKSIELVLVNTAAVWCQACRVEHRTLPARNAEFGPRGLSIISLLFQDAAGDPATIADLVNWTETFRTDFPMALDPEYQLGRFASAETAPLNLVVDAKSMKILERFIGDQEAVLWPLIEDELSARGR